MAWEPVEIEDAGDVPPPLEPAASGLQASPLGLHAAVLATADHLEAVQRGHEQVLAAAASLPGSAPAAALPRSRQLTGVLAELHGQPLDGGGFQLPLLGCDVDGVDLAVEAADDAQMLRLAATSREGHTLERVVSVPAGTADVQASWHAGELVVRFLKGD